MFHELARHVWVIETRLLRRQGGQSATRDSQGVGITLGASTIRARLNGKRLRSRTRGTVQRRIRAAPAKGGRNGYFWVLFSIWTAGVIISLGWIFLWALAQPQMLAVLLGHGVLWLIGLVAIRFVDSRLVSEHDARLVGERYVSEIRERLCVANEIQRNFLPLVAPTIPGFDVGAIWSPADDVAGDFFDYVPMQHGNWGILVADVSGHGIDGALLMAEICAYTRKDGNSFGVQRACDLVHENRCLAAQQIAAKLLDAIREYTQRSSQDDDITAVVLKVN